MTKEEILREVSDVLKKNSNPPPTTVQPIDKLKRFVPPPAVLSLAREIFNAFPKLELTNLTNSLYDPIATVGDLVDYIDKAYNA